MSTPPLISELDALEPEFRVKVEAVLGRLWRRGFAPKLFETRRTKERQAWLYASGRTRPGSKVTWTMRSKHLEGLAADIIDGRLGEFDGRPGLEPVGWGSWPRSTEDDKLAAEFFAALGEEAEEEGLVWGGNWSGTRKDLPHIEAP